jgi:hypothetical protein
MALARQEAMDLRAGRIDIPAAALKGWIPWNYSGPAAIGELVDPKSRLEDLPQTVSNTASVDARRLALRELAETVEAWTCRSAYATTEELQALFDTAYRALPTVESLSELLKLHPRGAQYLDKLPPAAA